MIPLERILESRILIVDDQEANLLLLEKILEGEGYGHTLTVADPRQVLDLCLGFRPDLLLLDLHMPYLDGFAVMEQLQEAAFDPYLPVLVLTADCTRETKLRALRVGARDFLTKPFDHLEVMNRIRNMLEVRLLQRDLLDQNRILEEKVRERTLELADTRMEVIHRLSRAAEFRDQGTGLHLLRMSQFALCLAEAAGLDRQHCDLILAASPMHDIGKIGIPDRILFKPGRLDDDEWAIMRTHTTIGAELLGGHDSALMRSAAQIALTHHERWDGRGYPRGLSGEDIPVEGRIVALSDVFDALLSERPYKQAWPQAEAIRAIDDDRGGAFEPALVDCFHEALPAINEIIARLASHIPPDSGGTAYEPGL
ncbi:MAG: HD domain-containing phosphohydrolase [Thermoanaerobaculaceae bacterium]